MLKIVYLLPMELHSGSRGYARRIIFSDPHLFILAHFHSFSFQQQILAFPKTFNPDGEELELSEDIDAPILCMISFVLSPNLQRSHLEILRDFSIWLACFEIRTAVQDVNLDINSCEKRQGKPIQPFWADPISRCLQHSLQQQCRGRLLAPT